jgi:hypothetical protein
VLIYGVNLVCGKREPTIIVIFINLFSYIVILLWYCKFEFLFSICFFKFLLNISLVALVYPIVVTISL